MAAAEEERRHERRRHGRTRARKRRRRKRCLRMAAGAEEEEAEEELAVRLWHKPRAATPSELIAPGGTQRMRSTTRPAHCDRTPVGAADGCVCADVVL